MKKQQSKKLKKALKSSKILGVMLSSTHKSEVLELISSKLKHKMKFYIVTPNPEILVHADTNQNLKEVLNKGDLAIPDGVGLILAGKLLKVRNLNLIKGRELMLDLFTLANEKKLKIFLLGSTKKVIEKSLVKIKNTYPNIIAKGNPGPMLDTNAQCLTDNDIAKQRDILDKINKFKPDLLFIAFGAPKQELWLGKHYENLKIGGAMVVGGSLDYFAGIKKPPPKFLNNLGLEWLWRLANEKGHLRRVIRATIEFPFLILKQKISNSH